jgi:putative FmdB family regulatory protein
MPTYEYHCRSCNRDFSVRERMDQHSASGAVCPECRSRDVERVISDFYPRTPRKS